MAVIRAAIDERRSLSISYADLSAVITERIVHPLGLFFWGSTWSVAAWCELRNDFRSFRLDRIRELVPLTVCFDNEPGQSLDDFFRKMDAHSAQDPWKDDHERVLNS